MITQIGICAGQVWSCLDAHKGSLSLNTLFSEVDAPREVILMALGWLAREGYVCIRGSDFLNSAIFLKNAAKDGSDDIH